MVPLIIRAIDQIIAEVRQSLPDMHVTQLEKTHAGDDDGIWWFSTPAGDSDIQLESATGNCPFLVETNEHSSQHARMAYTIEEAVHMIVAYLSAARHSP
jgi:hypothetical protein